MNDANAQVVSAQVDHFELLIDGRRRVLQDFFYAGISDSPGR
jgi:hypothetical protein